MDGGELNIKDKIFEPYKALEIIKDIINSYKKLYLIGMTHRDLKPQNFLTKK